MQKIIGYIRQNRGTWIDWKRKKIKRKIGKREKRRKFLI